MAIVSPPTRPKIESLFTFHNSSDAMLTSGLKLNSRFTLERRLGRGGMGEVWLIQDEDSDAKLVAKIVRKDAADDRHALLQREGQTARHLDHPNIVRISAFHHTDDYGFLTMPHIDGKPLSSLRGRSPAEIVRVSIRIADALAHAHSRDVVHRDLKLDNIRLDAQGRPHLFDFGVASSPDSSVLRGGGTDAVISPQQLEGEAPRATDDIYALGVLIYELITGELPLRTQAPGGGAHHALPAPMVSNHPVPKRLEDLVRSMLANRPEDRPRDAMVIRDSLESLLEELEVSEAPQTVSPPPDAPKLTPPSSTPPTLTPPLPTAPEVVPPILPPPSREPAVAERPHGAMWLTAIIFALLGLTAIAVFVLLPDWVPRQPQTVAAELPSPATTMAAAEILEPAPEQPPSKRLPPKAHPQPQQALAQQPSPEPPQSEELLEKPRQTKPLVNSAATETEAEPREQPPIRQPPPTRPADADVFDEAMTAGLAALDREDFEAAGDAFRQAQQLRPNSPQSHDGLVRAQTGLRLRTLTDLRQKAVALETEEDWPSAVEQYQTALDLDPNVEFAQIGHSRASARVELSKQLDSYLAST